MDNLEIDYYTDDNCSHSNRNMGIGTSFRNFDRCTEWDGIPSLTGKFETTKSTDPIAPEIRRLQSMYGFLPGEAITRFNAGQIVSSMQGIHFQNFFVPNMHKNPNNQRAIISPVGNLKRRGSDISSGSIKRPATLRNVDVTSLKIDLKLCSPKCNAVATKMDIGSLATSRNGDITSLEIGLKLSRNGEEPFNQQINVSITDDEDEETRARWKSERNGSFPFRRESFGSQTFVENNMITTKADNLLQFEKEF